MSAEHPLKGTETKNRGTIDKAEAFLVAHHIVRKRFLSAREKRGLADESYTFPKTLLIVSGHEGSGKSSVARTLEETIPVAIVDKDDVSDIFSTSRKSDVHRATRDAAYDIVYEIADAYLKDGVSALMDAPFSAIDFFPNPEWVKRMEKIAFRNGARIKVVWCIARPTVKRERMKARNSTRERDRTTEEVEAIAARTDIPDIPFEHIHFDTENPDAEALENFLELSAAPAAPAVGAAGRELPAVLTVIGERV